MEILAHNENMLQINTQNSRYTTFDIQSYSHTREDAIYVLKVIAVVAVGFN